ncbi:MAG: serine/threonine-protein kinase [Chloroflexi bacterium]|nr:serine/threonine-protein kinase [Chloroflexota bacterium]
MPDATVPLKIGRYEIREELGRGGMATVYRGFDPQVKRYVAVKVLPRELLHDPTFRARFAREAETIAALEHQAIVPLYDYGEDDGQPYFIMRLMPGGSLADKLKSGAVPPEQCARVLSRLAGALDEAHGRGFIHRDLKPGNILFDQHGDAYISDFGIAKLVSGSTTFTGSGVVGTPSYMSPEQGRGEKDIDGRSDVYALGAILFEMLTGEMPYQADTPVAVMLKHITEPVPRVLEVKPDLPPGCETVIERALAKERDERFPTAGELASALASASRGEHATVARQPRPGRGQPVKTITKPAPAGISRKTVARVPATTETSPREIAGTAPTAGLRIPGWVWIVGAVIVVGIVIAALAVGGGVLFTSARITPTANATGLALTQVAQEAATAQFSLNANATATRQAALDLEATTNALITESVQQVSNLQASQTAAAEGTVAALAQQTEEAGATASAQESVTAAVAAATAEAQAAIEAQLTAPRVAFIANGDLWMINLDGENLTQLTKDGGQKASPRWLPDGRMLAFITGLCVKTVDVLTLESNTLICLNYAASVDSFEVSPDGQYFALSVEGKLHIGNYDPAAFQLIRSRNDMESAATCMLYSQNYVESASWSSDGKKLAVEVQIPLSGLKADTLRVFDFACGNNAPRKLEEFPGTWFSMPAYKNQPELQGWGWDSDVLFAFVDNVRNEGFGNIYVYNTSNKRPARQIFPIAGGRCCYRDPQWSPDGSTLLFAFQDIEAGANSVTGLYYIPYGQVGTGASATKIPLPDNFFSDPRQKPQLVMAPTP